MGDDVGVKAEENADGLEEEKLSIGHAHSTSKIEHHGASGLGVGLGGAEQTKDFPAFVRRAGQTRDHLLRHTDRACVIGVAELPSPARVEDLADLLVTGPVGLLAFDAAVGGGLASCGETKGRKQGVRGHYMSCTARN